MPLKRNLMRMLIATSLLVGGLVSDVGVGAAQAAPRGGHRVSHGGHGRHRGGRHRRPPPPPTTDVTTGAAGAMAVGGWWPGRRRLGPGRYGGGYQGGDDDDGGQFPYYDYDQD